MRHAVRYGFCTVSYVPCMWFEMEKSDYTMRTRTRSQASHKTQHASRSRVSRHAYATALGCLSTFTHHTYHVSLSAEPPSLKTSHTPAFAHARHSCFVLLRSAYLPVAHHTMRTQVPADQHNTTRSFARTLHLASSSSTRRAPASLVSIDSIIARPHSMRRSAHHPATRSPHGHAPQPSPH